MNRTSHQGLGTMRNVPAACVLLYARANRRLLAMYEGMHQ